MARVVLCLVPWLLGACALKPGHAPASAADLCVRAAARAGFTVSPSPDDATLVFGPVLVEEKIWRATSGHPALRCILHGGRVHSLVVGAAG